MGRNGMDGKKGAGGRSGWMSDGRWMDAWMGGWVGE